MSLPRFSINQSLFVNLVSVMIIIIGLMVLFGMNKEIFPNVDFDVVSVTTVYPGATPLDVEKLISVPIEKELKEVDDIKEIRSSSALGASFITIEIDPDARNKRKVINDIKSAVDRVKDLPRDIYEDPVVTEITSRQYPVIEVSLSGDMPEQRLQYYADALGDDLEDIEGVAKIQEVGYRDREMQVLVDPQKMRQYYVSFDEIEEALASCNVSIPAGELNSDTTEYSVRTTGEFSSAEEVADVIIRANDAGNWIRIKDVAEVYDSYKKEDIINKTFSTRSINLIVMKKESGDALNTVDEVKEVSSQFLERAPGLEISYVNDYSYFARRRLNVLRNNGWISLVIVTTIMLVFLQRRVAIVTLVGIPIAFLTTFIIMGIMGITINLISMFGLIIVLGMLVDDGIIVAENSYRYMEEGLTPRAAAVKGTEQVMGAVTAAVFTTMAACSPLLFMTGLVGKFVRNIPTVVMIALLASLGEALIILPSHLADFVKIKTDSGGRLIGVSKNMGWFKRLVSFYTKVVEKAIKAKYVVVLGCAAIAVLSIMLMGRAYSGKKGPLKYVDFPKAGINFFFIRGEAPIGTPLNKTNELIGPIEDAVSEIPKEDMESYVTTVGQVAEDRHDPFAGQGSNLVQVAVYLKTEQDRKRTVDEIIEELREKTKGVQGFEELRFDKAESGPPIGKAVEARVRGEDFETLDNIAFEYMDYLKTIEGVTDVTWDHKPGKEEIRVKVDTTKATLAGLTVSQIARTVRGVFEGNVATKIKPVKAEEETDVTVMYPEGFSKDTAVFDNILVRNKQGKLIQLNKVADIEKVPGTTTIHHLDGRRVVTASSNIETGKITSVEVNKMLGEKFSDISERYMGYSVKYGGEMQETRESQASLGKAFLFAFLVIYLILASFFKSLLQPLIVMVAIPFGLIGVVVAFLVQNMALSFMATMGIVALSGIVVNDSIVLVSFINTLRREGHNRRDSIIRAGQMRIRAVLLTTITTCGGLSTVAYGIGGKDPFLVPMAMSISWGLAFATILTLVIIPCIYSIVDDIALKVTHHTSMINAQRLENGK